MARAYSRDLRERAVAAVQEEHRPVAEVAARYRITERTLYSWLARLRSEGTLAPKAHGGGRTASVDGAGETVLKALVTEQNDRTLEEYLALYYEKTGVQLSASALRARCAEPWSGCGSRATKTLRASEQDRDDIQKARAEFRLEVQRLRIEDLVFVDESGVDTRLVRRYARAHQSERAHAHSPFGSYERLTVLSALALEGILAPMSTAHATDTVVFLAYLDQVLIPELQEKKPGAVVVLDNLKPHKVPEVKEKLEAAGLGLLYLPAYSPDLSPMEPAWSKVKSLLRAAASRTRDALEAALAPALDAITASDACGFFAHCGYLVPEH